MLRQMIAAMGSTFALVGAVAAMAIIGTAAVVFDGWPTPGDAAPSARAPLAGDERIGGGVTTATGVAATPTGGSPTSSAPGRGASADASAGAAGRGARPGDGSPTAPLAGAPEVPGRDAGAPATVVTKTPGAITTSQEPVADAVGSLLQSGAEETRDSGAAAGAALGSVDAPAGASTAESADEAAAGVQQAADVVTEALRRLPPG